MINEIIITIGTKYFVTLSVILFILDLISNDNSNIFFIFDITISSSKAVTLYSTLPFSSKQPA